MHNTHIYKHVKIDRYTHTHTYVILKGAEDLLYLPGKKDAAYLRKLKVETPYNPRTPCETNQKCHEY